MGAQFAEVNEALARLLKAVQAGTSDDNRCPTAATVQAGVISNPVSSWPWTTCRKIANWWPATCRAVAIVVTAASGSEALATLAQTDVDVVLLDLLDAGYGRSGSTASHQGSPEWRATPVIVISGSQDMDALSSASRPAPTTTCSNLSTRCCCRRIKAGIERKRWHDREEQYRQQLERNEKFIEPPSAYLSDEGCDGHPGTSRGARARGDLRRVTIMMSDIRGFTTP